jgi:hypothetical protein
MADKHPIYVQEQMLARPNISTTLDTYDHVLPGMNDMLASGVEDALR